MFHTLSIEIFEVVLPHLNARDQNALFCSSIHSLNATSAAERLRRKPPHIIKFDTLTEPTHQDQFALLPPDLFRDVLQFSSTTASFSLLACNKRCFNLVNSARKLWIKRVNTLEIRHHSERQTLQYYWENSPARNPHEKAAILEGLLRTDRGYLVLHPRLALRRSLTQLTVTYALLTACGHPTLTIHSRTCVMCSSTFCETCCKSCARCSRLICMACAHFCFMCGTFTCRFHAPVPCSECGLAVCFRAQYPNVCAGGRCKTCQVAICTNHTGGITCTKCSAKCKRCDAYSPKIRCRQCK